MNRSNYEIAQQVATSRNMTLAALVEAGLVAIGVPLIAHPQQTPERARKSVLGRFAQRGSRERQSLEDHTVDACGFV